MENLFKKFTIDEEDGLRSVFQKPCKVNGIVYATDASIMIYTDEANVSFSEYSEDSLKPYCVKHLFKDSVSERIELDLLSVDLSVFKTEDEKRLVQYEKECTECNGWGEVEWEYGRYTKDFDCPKCDDSGIEEDDKFELTGGKSFDEDANVSVKGVKIRARYFELIQEAVRVIGEKCFLTYFDKNTIHLNIGNFGIICMGFMVDENPLAEY